LENYVLMHQCAISAKDINPKAASPDLLLSSAFAEQRPLVPLLGGSLGKAEDYQLKSYIF
jgi:hypothetical protein